MNDRHQLTPTPIRLDDSLKAQLKAAATANDRSLNGEVVSRLRASFQPKRAAKPLSAPDGNPKR